MKVCSSRVGGFGRKTHLQCTRDHDHDSPFRARWLRIEGGDLVLDFLEG